MQSNFYTYSLFPLSKPLVFSLSILSLIFTFLCINYGLFILSLVSFAFILTNTWIKNYSPIITLCLIFQWIQVSASIVQAEINGSRINVYNNSPNASTAVYLSLVGLIIMSLAVRYIITKKRIPTVEPVSYFNTKQALYLYILAFILSAVLKGISFSIPQLTQILMVFINVKWVLYYYLATTILINKKNLSLFCYIFIFELLLGFSGYFSEFKTVLIFTAAAILTVKPDIKIKKVLYFSPVILAVGFIFIMWTGVKQDYRHFLTQGTSSQSVKDISLTQRYSQLGSLLSNLDSDEIASAQNAAIDRLQYTKEFQRVIDYVPGQKAHENGSIWWRAIENILKPRMFFPNKGILDASKHTGKYTGRYVPGYEKGVSISIGYFGDSYIDFGKYGMFLPLIFLALYITTIYFYYIKALPDKFLSNGIATTALLPFLLFERASDKLLGTLTMNLIVFSLLIFLYKKYYLKNQ